MKTEYNKKSGIEKKKAVDDMFNIMLKGFSKISILEHENRGLRNAIIMEQKKQIKAQLDQETKETRKIVKAAKKVENDQKKNEQIARQAAKQLQKKLAKAAFTLPTSPQKALAEPKKKTIKL
ncbi:hypothetical protein BDZ45DRAFT_693854 [Acephala macrosclerotiorum]|nr:hypothetical protein BDZ45DRAFT_693854 [Acephala macrosclerotiorum]